MSARAPLALAGLTTQELAALPEGSVALVPVGSVEPHGPHLPLGADTTISEVACVRAAERLRDAGVFTLLAPAVPYGVTDFAEGFAGALSVPAETLTALLRAVVAGLHRARFAHVCLVNNHLEPAHDAAVRAAVAGFPEGTTSVACPLTRRWARTLGDEFRRGNCHAGRYETSLLLAAGAAVREGYGALPALEVSLSEGIRAGKTRFADLGMDLAYTGAPALASREEGDDWYTKLADMIETEVREGLARARGAAPGG